MNPECFRLYFLAVYGLAVCGAALRVVRGRFGAGPVERSPRGLARWLLPAVLIPFEWAVPIILLVTRKGTIPVECWPSRILGVALSLYAGVILVWTVAVLGRFLVPRAVIYKDHQLVTTGPFRFLRHPAYSGVLALWLGAAFGTLNGLLVLLFPVAFLGFFFEARSEENLLEEKFGESYQAFARQTTRFIPGIF